MRNQGTEKGGRSHGSDIRIGEPIVPSKDKERIIQHASQKNIL